MTYKMQENGQNIASFAHKKYILSKKDIRMNKLCADLLYFQTIQKQQNSLYFYRLPNKFAKI